MTQSEVLSIEFNDSALFEMLVSLTGAQMDGLPFGVIGFDGEENICIYNAPEAAWAGLNRAKVVGTPMFEVVAPCMNNYLVAERFKHAQEKLEVLDVMIDYVLTLRMRPTPCTLRLLANPISRIRFILVRRK